MKIGENFIEWYPLVEHERLILVVSGGGATIRKELEAGSNPTFGPADLRRRVIPEGSYGYELRVVPVVDRELRKKLAEARESGDERAAAELRREAPWGKGPLVQSGHFTVREGAIVPAGTSEPLSERYPSEVEGTVQIAGDLRVGGAKKFVIADPEDPRRELHFVALEGPEAGVFYRGAARTAGGRAVVNLPKVFSDVAEAEGLTVQLTPVGGWSRLFVVEKSRHRLVVVDADGGDVEFDFLVQGIRKGYGDFRVEQRVP